MDLSTGVSCYKYLRVQVLTSTLQGEVEGISKDFHKYLLRSLSSQYNTVHFLLDDTLSPKNCQSRIIRIRHLNSNNRNPLATHSLLTPTRLRLSKAANYSLCKFYRIPAECSHSYYRILFSTRPSHCPSHCSSLQKRVTVIKYCNKQCPSVGSILAII